MISELRTCILDCWEEWSLEGTRPADLSFIRRASTWLGDAGKVVFYIFRRGERQPFLIGKTVQSPRYGDRILREARNLSYIWERLSSAMPLTVPRPVALTQIGGVPVHLEEAIPGTALPERVMRAWTKRRRYRILAEAVSEAGAWLSKFIEAIGVEWITLGDEEIEILLLDPIRSFRARVDLDPSEQRMLDELEGDIAGWRGASIPLVAGHGDLWGGSLIWGRDGMGVVDWEFFQRRSLPLFDLFMLAVHPGVALNRDGGVLLDEFVGCFEESAFSAQVRKSVGALSQKLRLDEDMIPVLFLIFLVSLSNQRDDMMQSVAGHEVGSTWRACLRYHVAHSERLCILP